MPEHFGLVALCLMAIPLFRILNMFGLDRRIIAEDDGSGSSPANAATLSSVGIGVVLYGAAWVSARHR
ncbi:MAG: oligosaccharide flippase family protein [Thermomicrobiales bacterium]